MDETRAVARLPHLDLEIVHRRLPEQQAEQLAISLRASPSFDAFERHLEAQTPFWPWLALNPFLVWQRMLQQAWRPWLEALPPAPGARVTRDG
jgi:hypothetical protein